MFVSYREYCKDGPHSGHIGSVQLIIDITSINPNDLLMGCVYPRLQKRKDGGDDMDGDRETIKEEVNIAKRWEKTGWIK